MVHFDHRFERGHASMSADYRMLYGGGGKVISCGFDPAKGAWRDAWSVAQFQGAHDMGNLAVSFVGSFYGI